MKNAPWYRRWFGEEYLHLYPHRDQDEADAAVSLLLREVPLEEGGSVLDLACGGGRHLKALLDRGIPATGLDLSLPLLRRAKALAGEVLLTRGDMRELPFASGAFSAVTSFFTSFGYFDDEADDLSVLAEIRRVLRPGGHVLLDFLNADRVRRELAPRDERWVEGRKVIQERELLEGGRVVEKSIRIGGEGDEPRVFRERVRLYTAGELERLLTACDLEPILRLGSYAGGPHSPQSPRVILLARAG
jgi:SAM-dependent methyltransferase